MEKDASADIAAVQGIAAVQAILDVICRITGMGFAAVAKVSEDRWIACAVRDDIQFGLPPGGELKVETTICHEVRQCREAVIIDNVAEDPKYCAHPTPAMYGFQSYISMPIVLSGGAFFGTLCAIDPAPARLRTPETVGMFKLFAELIAFHLDAVQRLASSETLLLHERRTAELREQFIAVLGHDLRNPIASIGAGAHLLLHTPLNSKAKNVVQLIQSSVVRMSELVDNVLDFAKGRLGGGITLNRNADAPLAPVLRQVIAELSASHPGRVIEPHLHVTRTVSCDRSRIGQLFSNLLANALTHGASDAPISVQASTGGNSFELSVSNKGHRISPAAMDRLFQPFSRGAVQPSLQGLGLGLYIASEIARAHGGSLSATSTDEETCFTFRMPLEHCL